MVRCEKLSAKALAGEDTSAVRTNRTSRSRENFPRMGAVDILVNKALRARAHSSNLRAPAKRNVDCNTYKYIYICLYAFMYIDICGSEKGRRGQGKGG